MDKYKMLGKIANVYAEGGNILEYLRSIEGRDDNTIEDIMISYDFQAGSYNAQYRKSPDELNKPLMAMAEIMNIYLPENGYILCEAGGWRRDQLFPVVSVFEGKAGICLRI